MNGLQVIKFNNDRNRGQTVFDVLGREILNSCIIENSSNALQYIQNQSDEYYTLVEVDKMSGAISMVNIYPKAFKKMKKFLKTSCT